jgi:hypothetical protein
VPELASLGGLHLVVPRRPARIPESQPALVLLLSVVRDGRGSITLSATLVGRPFSGRSSLDRQVYVKVEIGSAKLAQE